MEVKQKKQMEYTISTDDLKELLAAKGQMLPAECTCAIGHSPDMGKIVLYVTSEVPVA